MVLLNSNRVGNATRTFIFCCGLLCGIPSAVASDLGEAHKAVRMGQFDQAFKLYRQAAEGGNPNAQYRLATLYLQGRGTAKNEAKAREWLEQAATADHPGAQYALALQIMADEGERAQTLLSAAADQGNRAAKTQLKRLASTTITNETAPLEAQWFGAARKGDLKALEALRNQGIVINSTDSAGRTALFTAVSAGKIDTVRWLLRQGVPVNSVDKFGLTPTQTAIERDRRQTLAVLLNAGTDKDHTLSNGDNLLHYAVRLQRRAMIGPLLDHGVDINHRNNRGWTPLDLAQYQEARSTVALLEQRGARNGDSWRQGRGAQDLDAVTAQLEQQLGNLPPIASAVVNDNTALLHQLLQQTPSLLNTTLADRSNLLILAVKNRKADMVEALLSHGVAVDAPGFRNTTALQTAARRGYSDLIPLLLAAGANPINNDDTGKDAIVAAIEEGRSDVARTLIDHVLRDRRFSGTPMDRHLLAAIQYEDMALAEYLLPHATNLDATDDQQRNALWFAARAGHEGLVEKLLNRGVPTQQADELGRTPFIMAINSGCLDCASLLLRKSDIDWQTKNGNTALMMIANRGDPLLTAWLLKNNADVNLRNQRGNTAIMEAVNANAPGVVSLLVEADANVTRKNRFGYSAIDFAQEVSPEMLELVRSRSVMGLW